MARPAYQEWAPVVPVPEVEYWEWGRKKVAAPAAVAPRTAKVVTKKRVGRYPKWAVITALFLVTVFGAALIKCPWW